MRISEARSPLLASGLPLRCKEGAGEVEALDSFDRLRTGLPLPASPYNGEEKITEQLMARYEHLPI